MTERTLAATGTSWALACPHHLATDAGAEAFRAGGNAIDAALAAAVTLAVVYPQACGVGGDLFALVQHPEGQITAVNASGAAPMGVDVEGLRRAATDIPRFGPHAVTVPGAVSGWGELHHLGARLDFPRAFERAIALAQEGVPVARSVARSAAGKAERLLADPGIAAVFFRDGTPLTEGDVLLQPALAATLCAIADDGPKALYGGEVGERFATGLRALGSPMVVEDLVRHKVELMPPLSGRYRDLDVTVVPPNSPGFVMLEILAAVERLGIDPDPMGPDAPSFALAVRAAGLDRDRHNADPHFTRVPVGTLLDDGHIAALCDAVRNGALEPAGPYAGGDTIALVAADAEGWAVSLIQSMSDGFGAGILEPATGIIAHNRGALFSLDPSSPNGLAGGKRSAHTLMPVLVHRADRLVAVTGTMGGFAQPQINAMNLIRAFDLGLDPAAAIDAPRWLVGGVDRQTERHFVDAEARVPEAVTGSLAAAGFDIHPLSDRDEATGQAHVIVAGGGAFEAATDPRADGGAAAG